MDNRGGCCIARYGGGREGGYDMSTVDRIMLRFRPIAPKPAITTGSTSPETSEVSSRSSRGKRRSNSNNNKRCNNGNNNRKRKALIEQKVNTAVVTLPLLPEIPDLLSPKQQKSTPTWLSFSTNSSNNNGNGHDPMTIAGATSFGMAVEHERLMNPQIMSVVIASCVTVECVTDTWVDADGLGYTDEERRMNLERDTCPGFISDGYGRVMWKNEAYKKMVGGEGHVEEGRVEVMIGLVVKEKVTVTERAGNNGAFTCRVRVQNQSTCRDGKEMRSITVPCDVWRMDSGGFAWRLDVKAALSLGW